MTKTVRKAKSENGLLGARLLKMSRAATAISAFMRTFGSEHRLLILSLLVEGERTVSEIERALGTRQAAVSQQLAVLREHRLVAATRDGKRTIYRIADPDVAQIITMLYDRFCSQARGLLPVADRHDRSAGVKPADQRRKSRYQQNQRDQRLAALKNQRPQAGRVGRNKQRRGAPANAGTDRAGAQDVRNNIRQSKHGKAQARQRSRA